LLWWVQHGYNKPFGLSCPYHFGEAHHLIMKRPRQEGYWDDVLASTSPFLRTSYLESIFSPFLGEDGEQRDDALQRAIWAGEEVWAWASKILGEGGRGYPQLLQIRGELAGRVEALSARAAHLDAEAQAWDRAAECLAAHAQARGGLSARIWAAESPEFVKHAGTNYLPIPPAESAPRDPYTGQPPPTLAPVDISVTYKAVIEGYAGRASHARAKAMEARVTRDWASARHALVDTILWQFEAYGRVVNKSFVDAKVFTDVPPVKPPKRGRPPKLSDEEIWEAIKQYVEPLKPDAAWVKDGKVNVAALRTYLRNRKKTFFSVQESDSKLDARLRTVLSKHDVLVQARGRGSSRRRES
jgi:hypothetical protein